MGFGQECRRGLGGGARSGRIGAKWVEQKCRGGLGIGFRGVLWAGGQGIPQMVLSIMFRRPGPFKTQIQL